MGWVRHDKGFRSWTYDVNDDFSARGAFFEALTGTVERCWAAGGNCSHAAIRAHSVQNARYIDLLEQRGHVVEFTIDFSGSQPEGRFREKGRNRATTFAGLCGRHDSDIFRPIDTNTLDLADPEHLFLLAYRAVLREMHACAAVGVNNQRLYQRFVGAGRLPGDQPSPLGMFAVQRLMVAYETHLYQAAFDKAHAESQFDSFDHDVIILDGVRPSVGAAGLFSLEGIEVDGDAVRAALTVLPVSMSRTVAVLSYTLRDAEVMRPKLAGVLKTEGQEQQLALSQILLNSCENFVLAPAFFSSWGEEKRQAVSSYFMRTIFSDSLTERDEHLGLFWGIGR